MFDPHNSIFWVPRVKSCQVSKEQQNGYPIEQSLKMKDLRKMKSFHIDTRRSYTGHGLTWPRIAVIFRHNERGYPFAQAWRYHIFLLSNHECKEWSFHLGPPLPQNSNLVWTWLAKDGKSPCFSPCWQFNMFFKISDKWERNCFSLENISKYWSQRIRTYRKRVTCPVLESIWINTGTTMHV